MRRLAALLITTAGLALATAPAPANAAGILYVSCPTTLAGQGFWSHLGKHGITCAQAKKVANDWIHKFQPSIKAGHAPTTTKYVDDYACRLVMVGGESGRVTCGFRAKHLRFYGNP